MNNDLILCTQCRKYSGCKEPCYFVEQQLNALESTHNYMTDTPAEAVRKDYKHVLAEMAESQGWRSRINIENIIKIPETRLRAIAVMLYSDLSVKDIASILKLTSSQVRRIAGMGQQCPIVYLDAELDLPSVDLIT